MAVAPPTAGELQQVVVATEFGLRLVATVAIVSAVTLYGFIAWLVEVVDRGCPACSHCLARRRRNNAAARDGSSETAQAERLFGVRRVEGEADQVEASEAAPSGDALGDAGPAEEEG